MISKKRKTKNRKNRAQQSGAAIVVMILVVGGLAFALLNLANQTSLRLKSIRNASLETLQCNELIALGEKILMERLRANPETTGETNRVELSQSTNSSNPTAIPFGIIELVKTQDSHTETEIAWTISVRIGTNEDAPAQASKTIFVNIQQEQEART